jgi:hypothetical protein
MKLFTALGVITLGAAGTFLYLHVRRGGRMSMSSFRDTAGDLFGRAKRGANDFKDKVEPMVRDITENVTKATERPLH